MERAHLSGDVLPLGLQIELDRGDAGLGDGFGVERALPPRGFPLSPRALTPERAWLVVGGLLALAASGWATRSARVPLFFVQALEEGLATLVAGFGAWAVFAAARWAEASLVGSCLRADGAWARARAIAPRVEPVCWRLGLPPAVAAAAVSLPLAAALAAHAWSAMLPAPAVGVITGAALYLVVALYPLRPGVGGSLLEDVLHVRDLPNRLRWTLVARFLPVPSRLRVDGSRAMVSAALVVVAWAAGTGAVLSWIAYPPPEGATLWGRLWQAVFALTLFGYGLWLALRTLRLIGTALALRGPRTLGPLEPSEALRRVWSEQNPLARHLPFLKDAHWSWHTAPAGTALIRRGVEESCFLWLAQGSAHVLGRTPAGDPILVAGLRGGCGVGEVALLEGGPRTADVIAAEDSVVAILERSELDRTTDAGGREAFRDLVHASQALARAPTLWGLAPDDRATWLSSGEPRSYRAGDVLIRQGESERWIGLVVRGSVGVERDGAALARLRADDIFGEMAYLHGPPRRATLTALDDVLVWSWSSGFLDRVIGTGELRETLGRLSHERST